jgi:hypothetical protein
MSQIEKLQKIIDIQRAELSAEKERACRDIAVAHMRVAELENAIASAAAPQNSPQRSHTREDDVISDKVPPSTKMWGFFFCLSFYY